MQFVRDLGLYTNSGGKMLKFSREDYTNRGKTAESVDHPYQAYREDKVLSYFTVRQFRPLGLDD